MNLFHKTALLFTLFILTKYTHGQSYTVSRTTEPYEDLQNPLIVATGAQMAEVYNASVSFDFSVFGLPFNLAANSGTIIYRTGYIVETTHGIGIGAFYGELTGHNATTSISYEITGTAPQRILKFQWKNMGLAGHAASDFVNAQLWLHEENNIISVHIGPHEVTSAAAFLIDGGPEIGFYRLGNNGNWAEKAEIIGDPKSPVLITTGHDQALNGVPQENTVYTFYPPDIHAGIAFSALKTEPLLFPNPAHHRVTLFTGGSPVIAELYDITGRYIETLHGEQSENGIEIDITHLNRGLYLCKITGTNGISTVRLIAE